MTEDHEPSWWERARRRHEREDAEIRAAIAEARAALGGARRRPARCPMCGALVDEEDE